MTLNRRIYLRITNKCNRQCSFCYYKNDPKITGDMTLDTLKEILEKELETPLVDNFLRVELSGGEPSLSKNINKILEYLSTLPRVYFTMETNGTNIMNSNFLELAVKFKKINFLKISLNSELIDSDLEWINNIVVFQQFAKENNINYVFNARFKDQNDKNRLEQIIKDYNIYPSFGNITFYPIHDVNLYRDGKLPYYGKPMTIYDIDGTTLVEYHKIK